MDLQQHDQIADVKGFLKRLGERLGQLVILVILCLLCVQCINFCNRPSAPQPSNTQSTDELKAYAWTKCHMLIEQALTSPSSADFPWSMDVHVEGNTYRVASYVDAKNAFGVEIRTNYYCQLTYIGGTDFKTDELTIIK